VRPVKVNWLEWSDEAFRKARAEDKLIVLALSAPWCEGCREMDETTYGDDEVAGVLNRDYVPVYVDTDRRPDVNDRYNVGGWPCTAFLTPSGDSLGGWTYLGRDDMRRILAQLKFGYEANRDKIAQEIARRDEKIARVLERPPAPLSSLSQEVFRKTVRGIVATFDPVHAGFGQAPKFPLVPSLRVVLQALHETQGPDFDQIFRRTLDAMGDRGMFDSRAGGFFHYVTNDVWSAPRFEKMGEDNAALLALYLDASLVTGNDKYAARALQTLEWVEETLLDRERGVFFGSQAADPEYYLLGSEERARRKAPPVDRTVYLPATAALASAYLRASEVLGEGEWASAAIRGLDWCVREMVTADGAAHVHDGKPGVFGLLRAPVALASALLDAYDHGGDARHLEAAARLTADLPEKFWTDREKGLGDRRVEPGEVGEMARPRRQIHENALAAQNFARLWRITGDPEHRARAERILLAFPDFLDGYGHATAEYALAADWLVRPPHEARRAAESLRAYLPRRVVRP
jgi:hypothetical protein